MKRSPLGPGKAAIERGSTFKAEPKPLKRTFLLRPTPSEPGGRSSLKPGRGFAASKAQREKVAGQKCVVVECFIEHCDPAHLSPRAMGRGCDSPLCVVAICRGHHEMFDAGDLDLTPHLAGRGFEAELAHMQGHYEDPYSVLVRLSGQHWIPDPNRSTT